MENKKGYVTIISPELNEKEENIVDRRIVSEDQTVPSRVFFENRSYSDVVFGIVYICSYVSFLVGGLSIYSNAYPRYIRNDAGDKIISDHFREDVKDCCANGSGFICGQLDETSRGRYLKQGGSKLDGDEGIFDAFLEMPEVIFGLLSLTALISVIWIVLLRYFSKEIVIVTSLFKIVLFIYLGIMEMSVDGGSGRIYFIIAAGLGAYTYYCWNSIMFAAKMIKHSTIAMKENSNILIGSLFVKVLYVLNSFLFVLFFSKSLDVVEVLNNEEICEFNPPNYVFHLNIYLGITYLWTNLLLSQMRLSIICTLVGSWHFHPENTPGLFTTVKNTFTSSFGTLCFSSLTTTIAERILRQTNASFLRTCLNPLVAINLLVCIIGCCCSMVIKMLTKYAVILHVFTGEPFMGSAKKVYHILSRHFKNGFVTEETSKSVLLLGSYVFSIAIMMLTWLWVDDVFETQSYPGRGDATHATWAIAFRLTGLFSLWYPLFSFFLIIITNSFLQKSSTDMTRNCEHNSSVDDICEYQNTNQYWVPPLCAIFVGCIAMMFFTFIASIFLDIIDTIFLCFSIDKDNGVDVDNDIKTIVAEVPDYVEATPIPYNNDDKNSKNAITADMEIV